MPHVIIGYMGNVEGRASRTVTLDKAALTEGHLLLVDQETGAVIWPVRSLRLIEELDDITIVEATFVLETPYSPPVERTC